MYDYVGNNFYVMVLSHMCIVIIFISWCCHICVLSWHCYELGRQNMLSLCYRSVHTFFPGLLGTFSFVARGNLCLQLYIINMWINYWQSCDILYMNFIPYTTYHLHITVPVLHIATPTLMKSSKIAYI